MALNVTRFLATQGFSGGTDYRNRITGQRYSIEPSNEGGVVLFRGNRAMTLFPVSRSEALCLIELDSVPFRQSLAA